MNDPVIRSYHDQLVKLAAHDPQRLKDAFLSAGVPDSTYYRMLNGQDIRYGTARKVARALSQPHPPSA